MLLSMWNIFNALIYADMTPMISDGRATAHDVRLIASSYLDDSKVYVGPAGEYFESGDDDTLIVHRKDMILVRGVDVPNVFDELCAVIERFDAWELRIAELSVRRSALQDMVDASDDAFGVPLFLYAPDGHALALSSAYGPETHPHWAGLLRDGGLTEEGLRFLKETIDLPTVFLDKRPTRRDSSNTLPGSRDYIHCSLFPHGYMAAHLVCFGFGEELPAGSENLLGVLAKYMTAHMEAFFSTYNPLSKLAAAFKEILAGGEFRNDEMLGLTRAIRWHGGGPFRISCIGERAPEEGKRQVMLPSFAKTLGNQMPGAVLVVTDDELVVVEEARGNAVPIDAGDNYAVGKSTTFRDLSRCQDYYLQAKHELARCREAGCLRSDAVDHRPEELAAHLRGGRDASFSATYLPGAVADLIAHDARNATSYYETLRAYCLSGFRPAMAAQLLGMHRNSLSYRLERMHEVADLSEVDAIAAMPTIEGLIYLRNAFAVADAQLEVAQ